MPSASSAAGDLHLFGGGKLHPLRLLAVAQRGVKEVEAVLDITECPSPSAFRFRPANGRAGHQLAPQFLATSRTSRVGPAQLIPMRSFSRSSLAGSNRLLSKSTAAFGIAHFDPDPPSTTDQRIHRGEVLGPMPLRFRAAAKVHRRTGPQRHDAVVPCPKSQPCLQPRRVLRWPWRCSNSVMAPAVFRSLAKAATTASGTGPAAHARFDHRMPFRNSASASTLFVGPIHRLAVMGAAEKQTGSPRPARPFQQVAHGEEIAQRFGHLLAFDLQHFVVQPIVLQSPPPGLAQQLWAISFSWCGNIRSLPPPWMSKCDAPSRSLSSWPSIRCASLGGPRPQGLSQPGRSSVEGFHSTKSIGSSFIWRNLDPRPGDHVIDRPARQRAVFSGIAICRTAKSTCPSASS